MSDFLYKMFDVIYRNILSADSLRQKRRNVQIHSLQYFIDRSLETQAAQSQSSKCVKGEELKNFLEKIVKGSSCSTPNIVGVKTLVPPGNSSAEEQPTLILCNHSRAEGTTDCEVKTTYYLPLVEAGIELKKLFENELTSNAFCFVADASSGLGSEVIGDIVSSCDAGMVSTLLSRHANFLMKKRHNIATIVYC